MKKFKKTKLKKKIHWNINPEKDWRVTVERKNIKLSHFRIL